MCGPLCDAVTAGSGGEGRLVQLERTNGFVIPLAGRQRWYRYHHLFADLLRVELTRQAPGLVDDLHRRAGAWYQAEGLVADAVHHAIAGHDVETAVALIGGTGSGSPRRDRRRPSSPGCRRCRARWCASGPRCAS
jgi:LuxR family maltose regulon positive regulatory protein